MGLAQEHEESGLDEVYIAAHFRHVEGLSDDEATTLLRRSMEHTMQEVCVASGPRKNLRRDDHFE